MIGREEGTCRLIMTIGGKVAELSPAGTAKKSVSRTHCKLVVGDDGKWALTNLKASLATYVDGVQILTKEVNPRSQVVLGADQCVVDMKKVEQILQKVVPAPVKTFSLLPLEKVWNDYEEKRMKVQLDEQKKANLQRLQGVLSMLGMMIGLVEGLGPVRFVVMGLAASIAIFFFIRGSKTSNALVVKLKTLEREFQQQYICPNPECDRYLGVPWISLKDQVGCPKCKCKYTC